MDPKSFDTNGISGVDTALTSPISTSSNRLNHSSPTTPGSKSPRRSVRLSLRSPQLTTRSSSQSKIHRTISGGVNANQSPKPNNRKRSSLSNSARGSSKLSFTHSSITTYDNNDGSVNRNIFKNNSLPSDQSDDEEIMIDNKTNSIIQQKRSTRSNVATRSEILNYFEVQTNGFKCKLCNLVSLL